MLNVEIRVKQHLDGTWSEWLGDLSVTHTEDDETLLTGQVEDQAVLYGLLARLRDLGLPLVLLKCEEVLPGDR